jgi:hypothetical protein
MSTKEIHVCEGCGVSVDNAYSTKGWIQISGKISRARGIFTTSWQSDYIPQKQECHDYCSLGCLEKVLNKAE